MSNWGWPSSLVQAVTYSHSGLVPQNQWLTPSMICPHSPTRITQSPYLIVTVDWSPGVRGQISVCYGAHCWDKQWCAESLYSGFLKGARLQRNIGTWSQKGNGWCSWASCNMHPDPHRTSAQQSVQGTMPHLCHQLGTQCFTDNWLRGFHLQQYTHNRQFCGLLSESLYLPSQDADQSSTPGVCPLC